MNKRVLFPGILLGLGFLLAACSSSEALPTVVPSLAPDRPGPKSYQESRAGCAAGFVEDCAYPTPALPGARLGEARSTASVAEALEIPEISLICQAALDRQPEVDLLVCMADLGEACESRFSADLQGVVLAVYHQYTNVDPVGRWIVRDDLTPTAVTEDPTTIDVVACIQPTSKTVGCYKTAGLETDCGPLDPLAKTLEWEVRLVQISTGWLLAEKTFQGGPPPATLAASPLDLYSPPGVGEAPVQSFLDWIARVKAGEDWR